MKKLFSYTALAAGLLFGAPAGAVAGELSLTIANGRVTLIAQDVTVRQILAEWARIGQTQIVNGEKVMGPPLTLELRDVPEAKALETVLRSAAGYMLAPRTRAVMGTSSFDSIVILATSRAPAVSQMPPAAFTRAPQPQPVMPPVDDDDGDPQEAGPPTTPMPMNMPVPGPTDVPGMQQPVVPQGPLTAPRPGQLPQPQVPGNPYQPNQLRPPGTPVPGAKPRPGGGSGGQS
jgi:hypothetical protein